MTIVSVAIHQAAVNGRKIPTNAVIIIGYRGVGHSGTGVAEALVQTVRAESPGSPTPA